MGVRVAINYLCFFLLVDYVVTVDASIRSLSLRTVHGRKIDILAISGRVIDDTLESYGYPTPASRYLTKGTELSILPLHYGPLPRYRTINDGSISRLP